jgi:hypothetical protein
MTEATGSADAGHEDVATPPATGNAAIDEALAGLTDLGATPLHEHHDRLAQAQAALQAALEVGSNTPRDASDDG